MKKSQIHLLLLYGNVDEPEMNKSVMGDFSSLLFSYAGQGFRTQGRAEILFESYRGVEPCNVAAIDECGPFRDENKIPTSKAADTLCESIGTNLSIQSSRSVQNSVSSGT